MTSPDEFDGGIDETDRDETEAALAVAIAGLFAGHAAGAAWLDLVQASLTGITQNYLRRSSMDMAAAAGLSGAEAAQAADEATTAVLGDIERHTAAWLKISADDRAPKGGTPMDPEQAQEAAGIIARSLATYSRERVREHVAQQLGAKYKTWHCVVPETEVCGLISAVSQRPYVGDLVSLHTGSPRRLASPREFDGDLTVTPNHMILSQRGWVRADEMQVGDYLVRCHLNERASFGSPDVEESPASIIEIFRAASESHPAERMMRVPVDFDAESGQGYVDVVATDSELADRLQPPLTEPAQHFLFTQTDEALPGLLFALNLGEDSSLRLLPPPQLGGTLLVDCALHVGIGMSDPVVACTGLVSQCDARVLQDSSDDWPRDAVPLRQGENCHAVQVVAADAAAHAVSFGASFSNRESPRIVSLLATRSGINEELVSLPGRENNASPGQSASDSHRTYPQILSDLLGALSSLVSFDEIVKIQRHTVSVRHGMSVLDCSTGTAWYVADGFIVHNSRGDDRVRPAHAELAGTTKRLEKPFSVAGFDIMRPGDPEAPPDLVIGCRCHLAYSASPV